MAIAFVSRSAAMCALALGIAWSETSQAREGDLDFSFADHGRVYLGWPVDSGVLKTDIPVAILGSVDGGAIVVGNVTDVGLLYKGKNAIGVAKLNATGGFDATFGDAGTPGQTKIHGGGTSFFLAQIRANGATLQRDGKIVIVGNSTFGATGKRIASVWRLNADGSLDAGFGTGGEVDIDEGRDDESDSGNAVAVLQGIDPNSSLAVNEGRIVVAGMFQFDASLISGLAWLSELNSDGSAYSGNSFGVEVICDPVNGYHDYSLSAIRFVYNGELDQIALYAVGNCVPRPATGALYYPFLIKVDDLLHEDPNWGNSGQAGLSEIFDKGGVYVSYPNSIVEGLDAEPNGSVVFSGYYGAPDGSYYALYGAVKADGQLDQTWTNGGVTVYARTPEFPANAVMFDPSQGTYVDPIIAGHQHLETCPPPPAVCGGLGYPWWATRIDLGQAVSAPAFCNDGPSYQTSLNYFCFYSSNASSISAGGVTAMSYTPGRRILLAGYVTFSDGSTDFQVQRLLGDEMFFNGFGVPSTNFN